MDGRIDCGTKKLSCTRFAYLCSAKIKIKKIFRLRASLCQPKAPGLRVTPWLGPSRYLHFCVPDQMRQIHNNYPLARGSKESRIFCLKKSIMAEKIHKRPLSALEKIIVLIVDSCPVRIATYSLQLPSVLQNTYHFKSKPTSWQELRRTSLLSSKSTRPSSEASCGRTGRRTTSLFPTTPEPTKDSSLITRTRSYKICKTVLIIYVSHPINLARE